MRIVHNANEVVGAESCCNFNLPPVRPPWGLQGTISSSPAPPSEWLVLQSISAQTPKPGSVQIALHCASLEKKCPRNEIKVIQGVCSTLRFAKHSVGAKIASRGEWSPPQSPRVHPRSRAEGALGDFGGRKEKATHHLCNGRSIIRDNPKAHATPTSGSRASQRHILERHFAEFGVKTN